MPGGDKSGPVGTGPMTGRAAGFCAGYGVPGCQNPISRRWFGTGCGRRVWGGGGGHGRRNMFHATGLTGWQRVAAGWPMPGAVLPCDAVQPPREQQLQALRTQAEYLDAALNNIREQIEKLDAEKAEK